MFMLGGCRPLRRRGEQQHPDHQARGSSASGGSNSSLRGPQRQQMRTNSRTVAATGGWPTASGAVDRPKDQQHQRVDAEQGGGEGGAGPRERSSARDAELCEAICASLKRQVNQDTVHDEMSTAASHAAATTAVIQPVTQQYGRGAPAARRAPGRRAGGAWSECRLRAICSVPPPRAQPAARAASRPSVAGTSSPSAAHR